MTRSGKKQASQLINRLTKQALSEESPIMDASQVQAARVLLAKAIPDLTSTTVSGNPNANPRSQRSARCAASKAAALFIILLASSTARDSHNDEHEGFGDESQEDENKYRSKDGGR
jgi:hypothetical protein